MSRDIIVWIKGSKEPLSYENVDSFYETRKGLEIIQDEAFLTVTIKIMKDSIVRYKIIERR